jgi:hypothetical protein
MRRLCFLAALAIVAVGHRGAADPVVTPEASGASLSAADLALAAAKQAKKAVRTAAQAAQKASIHANADVDGKTQATKMAEKVAGLRKELQDAKRNEKKDIRRAELNKRIAQRALDTAKLRLQNKEVTAESTKEALERSMRTAEAFAKRQMEKIDYDSTNKVARLERDTQQYEFKGQLEQARYNTLEGEKLSELKDRRIRADLHADATKKAAQSRIQKAETDKAKAEKRAFRAQVAAGITPQDPDDEESEPDQDMGETRRTPERSVVKSKVGRHVTVKTERMDDGTLLDVFHEDDAQANEQDDRLSESRADDETVSLASDDGFDLIAADMIALAPHIESKRAGHSDTNDDTPLDHSEDVHG